MQLRRGDRPLVRIGHRGAPALAPENTLESFAAAAELGVDVVEFDVLELPEGGLVVAHDLGAARAGAAAPLGEALDLLAGLGVGLHLDLKSRGVESAVADALRARGLVGRTFVSSVSHSVLRALRAVEPELRRAVGYPDDRFGLASRPLLEPVVRRGAAALRRALPYRIGGWVRSTGASVASLHWAVVSPELVRRCHALDVAVYAWTVNDPENAQMLVKTGLDGIITDDPRILDGFVSSQ